MKNFIIENKLSFEEGQRNTSIVTLIGFSQHLGLTIEQLKEELKEQIEVDIFVAQEVERLFTYCKDRNYKQFWKTPDAKIQYVFK